MKKILAVLLVLTLFFALVGCAERSDGDVAYNGSSDGIIDDRKDTASDTDKSILSDDMDIFDTDEENDLENDTPRTDTDRPSESAKDPDDNANVPSAKSGRADGTAGNTKRANNKESNRASDKAADTKPAI